MNKKCQIFTPKESVKKLLDIANYIENIYGKTVIENACGDGNILEEIVRRYIEDGIKQKKNFSEIKIGLQNDIYGFELDNIHYENCISKLNSVAYEFNLEGVEWNVFNEDFLKSKIRIKFDFIIGNPPYISYRDLDIDTRRYLKENFKSCKKGKPDYYYAFVESSLCFLNDGGRFAYLIPNNIFKNVFAKELRDLILPDVVEIIDYTTQKLFKNALTSSAILVCEKGKNSQTIEYSDIVNQKSYKIEKSDLTEKWIFNDQRIREDGKKRFGDYFKASVSIATLANDVYVLRDYSKEKKFVKNNGFNIERCLIREGVSPRSLKYNKKELILFPYSYNGDTLIRYDSNEFLEKFPEATNYLKSHAKKLKERKSDKNTSWFEYGRTQALAHLNKPKLLLSPVVTNEVNVYGLSKECIPYSGIYIIPKDSLSLNKAKKILESEDFYKYVKLVGINANGESLRITTDDINNYMF